MTQPHIPYLPYIALLQGVTGFASSLFAGSAQRAIYKSQANISKMIGEYGRKSAEATAKDIERAGKEAELIKRGKTKKIVGSQRAKFAAMGIDPNTGSAQDIQQETMDIGEIDAMTLMNNALRQAYATRQAGKQSAKSLEQAGEQSAMTGDISALSNILRGRQAFSSALLSGTDTLLTKGILAYEYGKRYGW